MIESGAMVASHLRIQGNSSDEGGGLLSYRSVSLSDVDVSGNLAAASVGGGLRLTGNYAHATVRRSALSGNNATAGGALYADCQNVDLGNVSLYNNRAGTGGAFSVAGDTDVSFTTVHGHGGSSTAVHKRSDAACPGTAVSLFSTLITDRCSGSGILSGEYNQYGPAASACPAVATDARQADNSVFGLSVARFGGGFDVVGWNNDGLGRPQLNFSPNVWFPDDVRGLPRAAGAADAGAFEQQ